MWRFVEDSSAALDERGAPGERVPADVVGGAAVGHRRARCCRSRCRRCSSSAASITLGTAFLLFQYVQLMTRPLEDLVQQLETVQKANGAMRRVAELLALEPTVVDPARRRRQPARSPCRVAASGSPTTTTTSRSSTTSTSRSPAAARSASSGAPAAARPRSRACVLRLVEPTNGHLPLGGVDIADIPMAELRRRVALVPQEVELFEGTDPRQRRRSSTRRRATRRSSPRSARVGLDVARRRRHRPPARRGGRRAVRRAGPAAGPRPGVAAPARPGGARRGHRPRRPGDRGAHLGGRGPADGRAARRSSSPTACRRSTSSTRSWCSTRDGWPSTASGPTLVRRRQPLPPPARARPGRRRRSTRPWRRRRRPDRDGIDDARRWSPIDELGGRWRHELARAR